MLSAMGSEGGVDNAADDVTLIAAQLANAAADAIDQTDERELEDNIAKVIEAAAAAAHGAAAGMVDAAGKATDPDEAPTASRPCAAVAGAHAAAAQPPPRRPPTSRVAETSAAATRASSRRWSRPLPPLARRDRLPNTPRRWQISSPPAPRVCSRRTPPSWPRVLDGGPSATELAAALASVSAALDQDPAGVSAGIQAVKQKAAAHNQDPDVRRQDRQNRAGRRARRQRRGERQGRQGRRRRRGPQVRGRPQGRHEEAGVEESRGEHRRRGDGDREEAPHQDALDRTRKKLAKVAEEANKAAAKGANGAAKAGEDLREMEGDIAAKRARKRKIAKAATAMHIVSAGMAHGAAKMMDEAAPDDDADSAADMGAMLASMQSGMDSLADAAGEVAEGKGIEEQPSSVRCWRWSRQRRRRATPRPNSSPSSPS